jgi:hypothetical protein
MLQYGWAANPRALKVRKNLPLLAIKKGLGEGSIVSGIAIPLFHSRGKCIP